MYKYITSYINNFMWENIVQKFCKGFSRSGDNDVNILMVLFSKLKSWHKIFVSFSLRCKNVNRKPRKGNSGEKIIYKYITNYINNFMWENIVQ